MIFQWFWFTVGQIFDFLFSYSLPDAVWVGMGKAVSSLAVVTGLFPAVPYIPYAAIGTGFGIVLQVFGALLLLGVAAWVLNIFIKFRS